MADENNDKNQNVGFITAGMGAGAGAATIAAVGGTTGWRRLSGKVGDELAKAQNVADDKLFAEADKVANGIIADHKLSVSAGDIVDKVIDDHTLKVNADELKKLLPTHAEEDLKKIGTALTEKLEASVRPLWNEHQLAKRVAQQAPLYNKGGIVQKVMSGLDSLSTRNKALAIAGGAVVASGAIYTMNNMLGGSRADRVMAERAANVDNSRA